MNTFETKAFETCKEKILKYGLKMELSGVEFSENSSTLIFFFKSDTRIDLRELVKDLALSLNCKKIELRQVKE